jgi:hypothetical protein
MVSSGTYVLMHTQAQKKRTQIKFCVAKGKGRRAVLALNEANSCFVILSGL